MSTDGRGLQGSLDESDRLPISGALDGEQSE